jgi:hypothetical protein
LQIFGTTDFDEIDIKEIVKKLPFPNLMISGEDDEMEISVDYMINEGISDEILCVKMNKELSITDFSHES